MLVLPIAVGYAFTHVTRTEVPKDELGVPHENVTLTTSDDLKLRGWYVPSRNGAAVIVFPGRAATQDRARFLIRHGYGVLLYDRRGEGESDGDVNAYGWTSTRTSGPGSSSSATARTSIRTASRGSACRSAAR